MRIEPMELKQNTRLLDTLLNQYNLEHSYEKQETKIISLGIMESDNYLGGVIGKIKGNTLHISLLGLKESFRGNGYGNLLITEAQKIAEECQCKYITVNTQDYQGLAFYKKIGFIVIGQLDNSPFEGTTKYYLKKEI